MNRRLLLLTISVILVSCSLISPTPDRQEASQEIPQEFLGAFHCFGHEGGMRAFAATVTIRENGRVTLEWMYSTDPLVGTWQYDLTRDEVVFSTDLEIDHARYVDAADQLEVHLREGVERAHVETGVMYCQTQ